MVKTTPSPVALWYLAPGVADIRPVTLGNLAADQCRIATRYSALSRGTESLVFQGKVPKSEYQRMATPLMSGQLPFPVTFGYCNVGEVIEGPPAWLGKTVFCLGPHQTVYDAPATLLAELPEALPAKRAVLAANMETALNAVWTGRAGPADRIAIIGGGVIGLLVAFLCSRLPGADVTLVDPLSARADTCKALGIRYAGHAEHLDNCDLVFHTSAHPSGLQSAIEIAGNEATVVELSWYGSRTVNVDLGGAFHSQQIRLQSCQVGHIEPAHRPRWSYHRRLSAALDLLDDPCLDALLEPAVAFATLPNTLKDILGERPHRLCQVIDYS